MIKVNLGSKKQAGFVGSESPAGSAKSSGGMGSVFDRFKDMKIDASDLQDIPLRAILLVLVIVLGGWVGGGALKKLWLGEQKGTLNALNQEIAQLSAQMDQVKQAEQLREQLKKDEFVLRSKIETIEKLINGRKNPVHLLMVLPDVIPTKVWVSRFELTKTELKIQGKATDYNEVNDFLKKFGESALISEISPSKQEQTRDQETGMELVDFEVSAKRREVLESAASVTN